MRLAVLLAVSCSFLGCEPKLVVGERTRSDLGTGGVLGSAGTSELGGTGATGGSGDASGSGGVPGAAGGSGEGGEAGAQCPDTGVAVPAQTDPIAVPWATGFENDFCDFSDAGGFCFGGGVHKIVTAPTHSGRYAAEFTVDTSKSANNQARCVRQGALPSEAYYGAWYYIPALATLNNNTSSLWNLLHFQGGDTSVDGLWDVSVVNAADGSLQLLLFDFLNSVARKPATPPPVPIDKWFHIQFYLKRASDATGVVRLYQDGKLLLEKTGIITDNSSWQQWYIGNIAKELTPAESTLYVDDVTIGSTGIAL